MPPLFLAIFPQPLPVWAVAKEAGLVNPPGRESKDTAPISALLLQKLVRFPGRTTAQGEPGQACRGSFWCLLGMGKGNLSRLAENWAA